MQAIGKLLATFNKSANKPKKPKNIEDNVLSNLEFCMEYIERVPFEQDLYRTSGDSSEIQYLEKLVSDGGALIESAFDNINSVHSITNAIKRVLHSHAPVIPSSTYEDCMGSTANYHALVASLPSRKRLFLARFCAHITHIIVETINSEHSSDGKMDVKPVDVLSSDAYRSYFNDMSSCVGSLIFRPEDGSTSSLDHAAATLELKQRTERFTYFLRHYTQLLSKEAKQVEQERMLNLLPSVSLNHPHVQTILPQLSPLRVTGPSAVEDATSASATADVNETHAAIVGETSVLQTSTMVPIQDRSIKISFPSPDDSPSEDELRQFFSMYGSITQVPSPDLWVNHCLTVLCRLASNQSSL